MSDIDVFNREEWLGQVIHMSRPLICERTNVSLPLNIKVSVGFVRSRKRKSQCWEPKYTEGGFYQIFIDPELNEKQAVLLLLEELCSVMKLEYDHFSENFLYRSIGFYRDDKGSVVPKERLDKFVDRMITSLGPYPHPKMTIPSRIQKGSRLLKVSCKLCGYICRVTQKWLSIYGPPMCPCKDPPERMELEP